MIADVVLPQMGLEVSDGTVTAVLVAPGDSVAEGETVVEVETDKAIAEVAAPRAGVITTIVVAVGDTIPVGATRAVLQYVASYGRTVVAAGTAVLADGRRLPFAASSEDNGRTWAESALPAPEGIASVTALLAATTPP